MGSLFTECTTQIYGLLAAEPRLRSYFHSTAFRLCVRASVCVCVLSLSACYAHSASRCLGKQARL